MTPVVLRLFGVDVRRGDGGEPEELPMDLKKSSSMPNLIIHQPLLPPGEAGDGNGYASDDAELASAASSLLTVPAFGRGCFGGYCRPHCRPSRSVAAAPLGGLASSGWLVFIFPRSLCFFLRKPSCFERF